MRDGGRARAPVGGRPLAAGPGRQPREAPDLRSAIFSELTYHAAYEPQRAIRTERYKYIRRFDDYPYPVLPNCDDSPSKDAYLERGWATRPVARESLHDLFFNPGEGRNLIADADYQDVAADLRDRLHQWMVRMTNDPLLRGPIAPPVGARINAQSQRSAEEPTWVGEAADAPDGPVTQVRQRSRVAVMVDEPVWICATCGVEHARVDGVCTICADERQWVPADGQRWTTLTELAQSGRQVPRDRRSSPGCWR